MTRQIQLNKMTTVVNTTMTSAFAIFAFVAIVFADVVAIAEDDVTNPKPAAEDLLAGMRLRAAETSVVQLHDGKRTLRKASADPVFRYSDEPRDILDATLWAYGAPGRPVAFQKIEVYHDKGAAKWFYCMTSLSESLIETKWRDGQSWSSKQPGITLRVLPDAPKPAAKEFTRLLQMKTIARRFDASLFNPPTDDIVNKPVHMRPLPRPLHRYTDRDRGIVDGAIFGFATSGTNPDALLAIELHRQGVTGQVWKYGLARMTLCEVFANLDEKEVWRVPFAPWNGPDQPSKFDTWLFFHEALAGQAPKG